MGRGFLSQKRWRWRWKRPVEVKKEEAPVQLKGSVKFEIKTARAAPTRPALDAFSQIEDIVEEAPPRARAGRAAGRSCLR